MHQILASDRCRRGRKLRCDIPRRVDGSVPQGSVNQAFNALTLYDAEKNGPVDSVR
jgi:hypothetical protein